MHRTTMTALAIASVLATTAGAQTFVADDFESYNAGEFPGGEWLDAAEIPEEPLAPIPSVTVEETTGPDGSPTLAISNVEFMGGSQGIYRFVPVSERYIVSADVRIDRLHDGAEGEISDWAFEIGVGQFVEGLDLCCTPQVGPYGSCFTGGWRLFVVGTNGTFADIDLGVPIDLGRWYRVEMDLDATRGVIRTRIEDAATGECLTNRIDIIEGWTPADGMFDIINFFESDAPSDDSTQASLCVLDNVEAIMIGGPCEGDFNGDGEVNTLDVLAFLNAWNAGCP